MIFKKNVNYLKNVLKLNCTMVYESICELLV